MELAFLPPCPPEPNPQEQAWGALKGRFFGNRFFKSIAGVVDSAAEGLRWLEAKAQFPASTGNQALICTGASCLYSVKAMPALAMQRLWQL